MTRQEARSILGLKDLTTKQEIKKRYHELIRQIHPDVNGENEKAHERTLVLNAAYSYLMKQEKEYEQKQKKREEQRKQKEETLWDAMENPFAFAEREIYHAVEGIDGQAIGQFVLTTGKYFWDPDIEEFSLFLLSMHQLSEQIIGQREEERKHFLVREDRLRMQAELAYLLAQQFVDRSVFETIAKLVSDNQEGKVYFMPAMLELEEISTEGAKLREGDNLYPEGMIAHRLYVKCASGERVGYLSFPDDRLYSIVIPMFEQKRAKVKIKIDSQKETGRRSGRKGYLNLKLWMLISTMETTMVTESINQKIEILLSMI